MNRLFHTFFTSLALISFTIYSGQIQAQLFKQMQELVSPEADGADRFGNAVDIDGTYAIVGAFNDDLPTGIGQSVKNNAGSACIFEQDSLGIWHVAEWIDNAGSSNSQSAPLLGFSVSISGNYAFMGVPDDDAAGIFNDPEYATKGGSVLVFERNTQGEWVVTQSLRPSDRMANDHFGRSVAVSSNGIALIGAEGKENQGTANVGGVYAYVRNSSGIWVQSQFIASPVSGSANYHFGWSCDLDGDRAIIGTDTWHSAHVYVRVSGVWQLEDILIPNDVDLEDKAGFSVAISGDYCIMGAYQESENASGTDPQNNAGAAYIFKRSGSTWSQTQKLIASERAFNHRFGYSVDMYEDRCAIGAPGYNSYGAVFIFERNSNTWDEVQIKKSWSRQPNEEFGNAVALDASNMIVGGPSAFPYMNQSRTGVAQTFRYCSSNIPIVSKTFDELYTDSASLAYQWISCDSNIIEGETNPTFTPTVDGGYRVVVSNDWCRDTSECYDFTLGIKTQNTLVKIDLYPNPTTSDINLVKPASIDLLDVKLINTLGQELQSHASISSTNYQISLDDLDGGIYFIRFKTQQNEWVQKVIKN